MTNWLEQTHLINAIFIVEVSYPMFQPHPFQPTDNQLPLIHTPQPLPVQITSVHSTSDVLTGPS